jgi:2,3-dihydroxyphenylpropionate 1,2-dioxygenase
MLPHAPQFFTMPETEDRATVQRVEAVAKEISCRLKALEPDLWLIFANDHAEQFFHNVAPPFTVHVGASATGSFAGRNFYWKVPGEIGFEIVKGLYRQGFDPAFTSTAKIDYAMGIPVVTQFQCNRQHRHSGAACRAEPGIHEPQLFQCIWDRCSWIA